MDWLYVLMPISGVTIFWPGLVILGIGVGIIGGFFGMGGAWMVTPGLNILGFPMAFAIGTDVAHMAGKSLISTMRHGKFGNVDYTTQAFGASTALRAAFAVAIPSETDAIHSTKQEKRTALHSQHVYSLDGRLVASSPSKMKKGLYIYGGRKVIK